MIWAVWSRTTAAPLLVWVVSCLAAVSVSAQQSPTPGAAFGGSGGGAGHLADRPSAPKASSAQAAAEPARSTAQWLARLWEARLAPAYTGTYVVWSGPGVLVSSRIWHVSKGGIRVERVDALSDEPRSIYRITDRDGSTIKTFMPVQRVLRIDRNDMPGKEGGFPNLPDAGRNMSPADYYDAQYQGQERVAGFMADVVQFMPRDQLRYGYRVWSEQRTGLAIKLQTLDRHGRVLEQAAFSGVTFDPPVNPAALLRQMRRARGWRVVRVVHVPTTASDEGWQIGHPAAQPVPGFALQRCYRHPAPTHATGMQAEDGPAHTPALDNSGANGTGQPRWFQCVFSDGLAAVSVFIEPYDATRHAGDHASALNAALGATHLLVRRVGDTGRVTVVGEVPSQTLERFAAGISRLP